MIHENEIGISYIFAFRYVFCCFPMFFFFKGAIYYAQNNLMSIPDKWKYKQSYVIYLIVLSYYLFDGIQIFVTSSGLGLIACLDSSSRSSYNEIMTRVRTYEVPQGTAQHEVDNMAKGDSANEACFVIYIHFMLMILVLEFFILGELMLMGFGLLYCLLTVPIVQLLLNSIRSKHNKIYCDLNDQYTNVIIEKIAKMVVDKDPDSIYVNKIREIIEKYRIEKGFDEIPQNVIDEITAEERLTIINNLVIQYKNILTMPVDTPEIVELEAEINKLKYIDRYVDHALNNGEFV